jgi:hypothetical protein
LEKLPADFMNVMAFPTKCKVLATLHTFRETVDSHFSHVAIANNFQRTHLLNAQIFVSKKKHDKSEMLRQLYLLCGCHMKH